MAKGQIHRSVKWNTELEIGPKQIFKIISDKRAKVLQWRKNSLFNKGNNSWTSLGKKKKVNLDLNLAPYKKN